MSAEAPPATEIKPFHVRGRTGANVTYFNEVAKGGHFATWEEPEIFASELRAAFKKPR